MSKTKQHNLSFTCLLQPTRWIALCFLFGLWMIIPADLALAQGPWVRPEKGGYIQLGSSFIGPYNQLFSDNENYVALNREVTDITPGLYAEYGLSKKFTLIGHVPLKVISTGDKVLSGDFQPVLPSGSAFGFSNIGLTGKLSLVKNRMAGMLRIETPATQDTISGLNLGYKSLTVTPLLSIGGSMGALYGYICTGIAFRNQNIQHDLLLNGEIGLRMAKKKLYLIAAFDGRSNLSSGMVEPSARQTGLYVANQQFLGIGCKTIYKFSDQWGGLLYIFGAPFGNNVAASPAWGAAVFYEWKGK